MAAEQQAEAKQQADVSGPVPAGPGFVAPALASAGIRSHENAILRLQETAGNRAVAGLLGGAQRAPASLLLAGIQRAPAGQPAGIQRAPDGDIDPKLRAAGRAERARLAIGVMSIGSTKFAKVNVEALAEALDGMTPDEAREVRTEFDRKFHFSLRGLIRGGSQIDGNDVQTDLYPNSRKRLLLLLAGTVEPPTVDPIAAMETGQAVGELVGSLIGKQEELGQVFGAATAVVTRDHNDEQARQVGARRRTAQAIQLKTWIDGGKREPIFALLRGLGAKTKRDERKALADAFEAQFGTTLYIALTKRFKDKTDWDRFDALLFEDDLAKDDRAATQAHIDKVKRAEAEAERLPGGGKASDLPGVFADEFKNRTKKVRDAKAGLEAHLEDMRKQPAAPGPTTGAGEDRGARSRLDAALGEGSGTAAIKYEIGAKTGVRADDLLDSTRRPEALAGRLARKYKDKRLKPGDIEATLRELREAAHSEAARLAREAEAKGSTEAPPTPDVVREAYFARFHAEFGAKAEKPVIAVLSEIGTGEDRNRNLLLLLRQGDRSDVTDLYLALRSKTKNMDRVREILEGKTRTEIGALAEDYKRYTGTDLGTALLGDADEVRRIKFPTADDIINGRLPKDLGKARKELDEKIRLLKGEFEVTPSAYVQDQTELVASLAATRDKAGTSEATGAVPVSAELLAGMSERVATEAEKDRVRGEAQFILGRIVGREVSVGSNRGWFAITRDDLFGNVENDIVRGTRDDAVDAIRKLDHALNQDPPDLAGARKQVNYLYLADARMKHNLGVYEQRTEEAFNAFVDAAVLAVTTIVTAGGGGPIIAALKATAATLAVKVVAKGPDYLGSAEMWGDIRSGAFSAAGGKLAEKTVGKLANQYLEKVLEKADKLQITGALKTRATVGAIKAASWEAENLVSGGFSGGLEAIVQGNVDPFTEAVGVKAHGMALGQHVAGGGVRKVQGAIAKARHKGAGAGEAGRAGAPPTTPEPGTPAAGATTGGADVAPPTADMAVGAAGGPDGPAPGPRLALGDAAPAPGGDSLAAIAPTGPDRGGPTAVGIGQPVGPTGPRRQRPLTTGEFEVPPSKYTAEQLGIKPGSALDTPRGRRNREEQLRREGKLPGPDGVTRALPYDAQLLEQSTGPTGGRRFAAEFTPALENWSNLSQPARLARIEGVVNKILADAGMPRVEVAFDTQIRKGDAAFSPGEWKMKLHPDTVNDSSPDAFAGLANGVAHETRHALHVFRGLRAGLHGDAGFSAPVRPDVLERARHVNRHGGFDPAFRLPHPNVPGDRGSLAYGEALDVIHEAFGPGTAERPTAIGAANLYRVRVRELIFIKAVRDASLTHQPFDPVHFRWAEEQLAAAVAREREAHNTYVKTAPEADAHRAGPAVGKAVIERLGFEGRLREAQANAKHAADQLEAAMLSGDATRIRDGITRSQHWQDRVKEARAALETLVPTPDGRDLETHLGAYPMIPGPGMLSEATTGPRAPTATGRGAAAGPGTQPRPARPTTPEPSLRSMKPGGAAGGEAGGGGSQASTGPGSQNELLAWAAEQQGPALEAARTRLAEADKVVAVAEAKLREAKASGGDEKRLELDVAMAKAGVGDAQVALVHAQNMAVRARQVADAMADRDAQAAGRTGRSGAPAAPAPAVPAPAGGGSTAGKPTPSPGAGGENELLVWAANQAGPVLEAAKARLTAARAAREMADRQLADARTLGGDVGGRELEVALARAKEGDAEVALGQAQNMAVRARRIAEGLAAMGTRPAPRRERTLATAPPRPNDLLVWATDQQGPALEAARNRLADATKAHDAAKKQMEEAKAGDKGRLELEVALAWAKVGDAQEALLQAQNMAVRAQRVAEGIEQGSAATANRTRRQDVEPIDDPNVVARTFIEQRGFAGGNLALQGPKLENEWRTVHQQVGRRPAAGWRRADGTVVVDASNRRVREAIERLARERRGAGPGGPGFR